MSIGSVFLGDARTRFRGLGGPTPPSSPGAPPPPSSASTRSLGSGFTDNDLDDSDRDEQPLQTTAHTVTTPPPRQERIPPIDPEISLELRIRWLEALLIGSANNNTAAARKGKEKEKGGLIRQAHGIQINLDGVIKENEGLKKFMDRYDQHAALLASSSSTDGPDDKLSNEEILALLGEMESDIRHADRDMNEIMRLEDGGVLGAGHLSDHETLEPRVKTLVDSHVDSLALLSSLTNRITDLIERHATSTDALSELFVEWDEVIGDSESRVALLERETAERKRLGLP